MNDSEILERLEVFKAKAQSLADEIDRFQQTIRGKTDTKPKRSRDIRSNPWFIKMRERRALQMQTGAESLRLQKQFKLKVAPHYSRVLRYQATNDPAVFDGLKREWE